jgi:aminoglycoside phosphotransferase (APT) family kinase protein
VGPTRTGERTGARATVFAKLHADEQGARAFLVAVGVADWLAACQTGVTAVRPLAYVAADGVVLYPLVAGRPLSRHLRRPRPGSTKHLWAAGAALRALHRAPAALASELERHDLAGEVKAIARTSEHIRALLPAAGATIEAILERAQTVHARLPPEPPTFAHGDFKADHLLVAPDGLRLIDFDSCCLADPALDVGKFLADLQWWYTAYGQPGVEQAQERFLAGYVAGDRAGDGRGAPGARLGRARLYEAVLLVKLAAHRVRLFDPDWAPRTEQLIGRARAGLHALQGLAAHPAA